MKILALVGLAGSGKSTLAAALEFDRCWKRTRFAEPIKQMIHTLLTYQDLDSQIATRMVDGDLKEIPTIYLNNHSPRHAMQTLGSEWRDLIDRNLWTDIWKRSLVGFPQNSKVVVDDCRFLHEAKVVRSIGGKILRITRPNSLPGSHISETEMASIKSDFEIHNNGTPEDLLQTALRILESWS